MSDVSLQKPPLPFHARWLERIGIRAWYRVIAALTGDRMMCFQRPRHTEHELRELRKNSRYYSWANFWRGVLYIPPVYALYRWEAWLEFSLLLFLVGVHFLCYLLEFYRSALAETLVDEGIFREQPEPAPLPPATDTEPINEHWYFSPKPWESERLYRTVGMEWLRKLVLFYTNRTKLGKEDRERGEKLAYVSGKERHLMEFERSTRTGEMLHLGAASFNAPPLFEFLNREAYGWAIFIALILFFDLSLVLLQRYHRVRVYRLLTKPRNPRTP